MTELYEAEAWMHVAEKMAADLSSERIDPNEATKASEYLNALVSAAGIAASRREGTDESRKLFFEWLERTNQSSAARALIRSNQTREYYEKLQKVCRTRLRDSAIRSDYEAAQAFGWAVRVARYFNRNPRALELEDPRRNNTPASVAPVHQARPAPRAEATTSPRVEEATPPPAEVAVPPPPVATPAPVDVGQEFEATVSELGKNVELEVPSALASGSKPLRLLIRKAEAKDFKLEKDLRLTVRVIDLNEYDQNWVAGCQIVAGAEKITAQPAPAAKSKKSSLEDILAKMQQEYNSKE